MTADYRVDLDLFSGPLDLLLFLVKRNEVDVCDVSLAKVASQFVTYLEVLQFIDLDLAGEFLVTASTLIEIKSRAALPPDEPAQTEDDASTEDLARSGLVRRLLEYRKFKEAAAELEERAARWQERYPRLSIEQPGDVNDPADDRIREVELWDLVSALGRVMEKKEVVGSTSLRREEIPVAVLVERIGDRVRREGRLPFSEFFEGTNHRERIVGVFLAILELVRHHGFRAEQPTEFDEIWIGPPDDPSPHGP